MSSGEGVAEQRRLAREIFRTAQETRGLARGSGAALRSAELTDGPVSFYDEDGNVVFEMGAEGENGQYYFNHSSSIPPPQPETPDIIPCYGGFIVRFDGTYVDDNVPEDFARTEIHVSDTPIFEKTDETQVNTYLSPDGGDCFVGYVGKDTKYVSLVTVNHSGLESAPCTEVEAISGGPFWETESYALTGADVTAGTATVLLSHELVVEDSVQVGWGGIVQAASDYTVDYLAPTVTVSLNGREAAGDILQFHYQYLVTLSADIVGLAVRGFRVFTTDNPALPTGTQVGDLVVMIATGGNDGGGQSRLIPRGGSMTDPRFTGHHGYVHGSPRADTGGDRWWGTVTDLSNVQVTTGPLGSGIIVTFYDTTGLTPLTVDNPVNHTRGLGSGNANVDVPIDAFNRRGVVAIVTRDQGTSGGDTPVIPTGYTSVADSGSMRVCYWTGDAPSPASTDVDNDTYQLYDRTFTLLPVIVQGAS